MIGKLGIAGRSLPPLLSVRGFFSAVNDTDGLRSAEQPASQRRSFLLPSMSGHSVMK